MLKCKNKNLMTSHFGTLIALHVTCNICYLSTLLCIKHGFHRLTIYLVQVLLIYKFSKCLQAANIFSIQNDINNPFAALQSHNKLKLCKLIPCCNLRCCLTSNVTKLKTNNYGHQWKIMFFSATMWLKVLHNDLYADQLDDDVKAV